MTHLRTSPLNRLISATTTALSTGSRVSQPSSASLHGSDSRIFIALTNRRSAAPSSSLGVVITPFSTRPTSMCLVAASAHCSVTPSAISARSSACLRGVSMPDLRTVPVRIRYELGNGWRRLSSPWLQHDVVPEDCRTLFAASFGDEGWHHIRATLREIDTDSGIDYRRTALYRFLIGFRPS